MAGIVLRGEVRTHLNCRETMKVGAELNPMPRPQGRARRGRCFQVGVYLPWGNSCPQAGEPLAGGDASQEGIAGP